jgi:hypothetical protein
MNVAVGGSLFMPVKAGFSQSFGDFDWAESKRGRKNSKKAKWQNGEIEEGRLVIICISF